MPPNKAFVYKALPAGLPVKGKDLAVESLGPFDLSSTPPPNGFLTKNLFASYDPTQRGQMRSPSIKSYSNAFLPGDTITAIDIVSEVLSSADANFPSGSHVHLNVWPVECFSTVTAKDVSSGRARLIQHTPNVPLTAYAGVLGMSGMTAYGGLHEIGRPKKGDTILVSAASGAVGQIVGQIAIREGLKVIGGVGDEEKMRHIEGLGFVGFNYKKEEPSEAIERLAPEGLDIFWDNVGGPMLDAALDHMKPFGRIVGCGSISTYNGEVHPIKNYQAMWKHRIIWQGLLVIDPNIEKHRAARDRDVTQWLSEGSLVHQEHIVDGIDNAVDGFLDMLTGRHVGKSILKIQG